MDIFALLIICFLLSLIFDLGPAILITILIVLLFHA
jgi:hypothetical protein